MAGVTPSGKGERLNLTPWAGADEHSVILITLSLQKVWPVMAMMLNCSHLSP